MARALSLAHLTAAPLLAPDMVTLASELGYQHVGIRIHPAAPGGEFSPLIQDRAMLSETRARLRESDVTAFDIEIIRLNQQFQLSDFAAFLDVCGELSARAILVAGDDPDETRLTANFVALCEAAKPYDLTINLEFMPWVPVGNCRDARRIVESAAQPNGRVLVDALHVARSVTSLDEIAALPRTLLAYAQICDAPAGIPDTVEAIIHTARCERLLPGDGGIPLRQMFAALPSDLPVSIEIPHVHMKEKIGVRAWAARALAASKQILDA